MLLLSERREEREVAGRYICGNYNREKENIILLTYNNKNNDGEVLMLLLSESRKEREVADRNICGNYNINRGKENYFFFT
jgi:hypothetical protein